MPYVEVWVDPDDDLSRFTEEELEDELATRRARKQNFTGLVNAADFRIPKPIARTTLNEAADELRKQGKTAMAFKLEEIREDFVGG